MRKGENTKFTLDRKLFTSRIWFASPWKLKIWIYLIGNANHKDGEFMGEKIKRGQLLRSYRTISEDCAYYIGYRKKKPSLSTVRRTCEELTKELRTTLRTTPQGMLITILNYNPLQPMPKTRTKQVVDYERRGSSQVPVHNKNDKNVKNDKKEKYIKRKNIPTKEEMVAYAKEQKIPLGIAGDCFYYYDKIGWVVGRNLTPMKNWKSALSGWWHREKKKRISNEPPISTRLNYGDDNIKSLREILKQNKT